MQKFNYVGVWYSIFWDSETNSDSLKQDKSLRTKFSIELVRILFDFKHENGPLGGGNILIKCRKFDLWSLRNILDIFCLPNNSCVAWLTWNVIFFIKINKKNLILTSIIWTFWANLVIFRFWQSQEIWDIDMNRFRHQKSVF